MPARRLSTPVALVLIGSLASLTGCSTVSYETYPYDGAPSLRNPDLGAFKNIASTALRLVAVNGPKTSDGRYAVNLHPNMSQKGRLEVTQNAGPGAEPVTPENVRSLPVYHVGRVWVRAGRGTVDVLVPRELGLDPSLQNRYDYDGYTLYMRGGLQPWRVERSRKWAPGTLDVPPLDFGDGAFPASESAPAPQRRSSEPSPASPPPLDTTYDGTYYDPPASQTYTAPSPPNEVPRAEPGSLGYTEAPAAAPTSSPAPTRSAPPAATTYTPPPAQSGNVPPPFDPTRSTPSASPAPERVPPPEPRPAATPAPTSAQQPAAQEIPEPAYELPPPPAQRSGPSNLPPPYDPRSRG